METPLNKIEVTLLRNNQASLELLVSAFDSVVCPDCKGIKKVLFKRCGDIGVMKGIRFIEIRFQEMQIRLKCKYCGNFHQIPFRIISKEEP